MEATDRPTQPTARSVHPHRRLATLAGLAVLGAVTLSAPVGAGAATPTVNNHTEGSLGHVLVTGSGFTLYHLTADKPNKPSCTGGCAGTWPPLLLPKGTTKVTAWSGASGFGAVKVSGGRLQVTYHSEPLYRYVLDTKAGQTKGQGVGGVWFVVHPTAKTTTAAAATTTHSGGYSY